MCNVIHFTSAVWKKNHPLLIDDVILVTDAMFVCRTLPKVTLCTRSTCCDGSSTTSLTCRSLPATVRLFLCFSAPLSLAGNSGCLTWERHSSCRRALLIPVIYVVFCCVSTVAWLPAFGMFNMCTDVGACDCVQGLYGHCKKACTGSC